MEDRKSILGWLLLLSLTVAAPLARAAEEAMPWSALNAEQRELLKGFEPDWAQMPMAQRAQLLANAERVSRLSPEQRERLKTRMKVWQSLPAEQRERLRAVGGVEFAIDDAAVGALGTVFEDSHGGQRRAGW